jgi:prepilin-type N-terminal cleavage/methylation domain-containing protein
MRTAQRGSAQRVWAQRAPAQPATQQGFTLLEAMAALALVAMIVLSYLGIRTTSLVHATEARNWRLARELAEQKMSELQAGAREVPVQSGAEETFEKYPGFVARIAVGESEVNRLESEIVGMTADEGTEAGDRAQWALDRNRYREASARGLSAVEYEDQLAEEDYQRRMEEKAPAEDEFEDVAVVVFFPKLDAEYEGQKESFMIKAKVSTLALSNLTPEQATALAESRGQTTAAAAAGGSGGTGDSGGDKE